MSYTQNIPVSGDTLGGTRDRIRANFQLIDSIQSVNHVAYGALGQGKHKFLQLPEQVSAPTTAANEGGFYTKVGASPAETNLFYMAESDNFEYQLTRVISASTARFATNTAYAANHTGGWTFLPGAGTVNGMLFQYGFYSGAAPTGTVSFPVDFTNSAYSVQTTSTSLNVNTGVNVTSVATGGFNFIKTFGVTFYWVAIGV